MQEDLDGQNRDRKGAQPRRSMSQTIRRLTRLEPVSVYGNASSPLLRALLFVCVCVFSQAIARRPCLPDYKARGRCIVRLGKLVRVRDLRPSEIQRVPISTASSSGRHKVKTLVDGTRKNNHRPLST